MLKVLKTIKNSLGEAVRRKIWIINFHGGDMQLHELQYANISKFVQN